MNALTVQRGVTVSLVLAVAALTGCQGMGLFLNNPKAKVSQVDLVEQSDEGGRVVATVTVTNPNEIVLPLAQAHYTVRVAGAEPFRFTTMPARAMPADGSQTVELPAAFARKGDPLAGRKYTVDGYVTYRPPGEVEAVLFGSGWPLPRCGFRREGTLTVSEDNAQATTQTTSAQ
jgi:hypothetical protein